MNDEINPALRVGSLAPSPQWAEGSGEGEWST